MKLLPPKISFWSILLWIWIAGCSPQLNQTDSTSGQPEPAASVADTTGHSPADTLSHTDLPTSRSDRGKRLIADEAMVSSAHPLASEAGIQMLKSGGNAVDAAVATAFALNVVEPNMSGVGGGGSMLIWEQDKQQADYVDFYTAKRAESYRDVNYEQYDDGDFNLLSTGIPGTVKGLLQTLERHGTMSREEVMQPAIDYATEGFPVYLTLAQFIREHEEKLSRYEGARRTFFPDGEAIGVGEILKQPDLAVTLQNIADRGASAFYEGQNARDMVEVLNEAGNPATLKDFKEYEPQWNKAPLKNSYKDYQVLSAPLPQTGLYIMQGLNVLETFDLAQIGLPTESAEAFDIISSTMRLSLADRSEYITDPNWADIPVEALTSKEYAASRSELVGTGSVPKEMEHGLPAEQASVPGEEGKDGGETTHISVVDSAGNAVSFSTTLSHVFGSGAWVNGFILNNSGFDFSTLEEDEDWESSHPYRVRASTISPTIILDEDNEVRLVIGAPGGVRIPTAVLQNIVYVLEYGLDPLDAVDMPRIFPNNSNAEVQIEKGFDPNILREVREMGYDLQALSQGYARLYLVSRENGMLIGVADPRHDGEVRGY